MPFSTWGRVTKYYTSKGIFFTLISGLLFIFLAYATINVLRGILIFPLENLILNLHNLTFIIIFCYFNAIFVVKTNLSKKIKLTGEHFHVIIFQRLMWIIKTGVYQCTQYFNYNSQKKHHPTALQKTSTVNIILDITD